MRRTATIVLVSILFIGAFAFGQTPADNPDPASREQVLTMMEVMNAKNQIKTVMAATQQQMSAMMQEEFKKTAPNANPQMVAEMSAAMQEMMNDMQPIMNDLLDEMVPIYQKHLSRTEVEAITNFYTSREGQSFLAKMPAITAESMSTSMTTMQNKMQPIAEKMQKRMEEIVKKYQSSGATGGSPEAANRQGVKKSQPSK